MQSLIYSLRADIHYIYIYNIRNRCNIWYRPRSDVRALIENGFRSNHHCIEEMLWTWDREVWLALTVFPVHLENTNEHYRFLSFVPISELHPNVLRLFLSFSRYLWLAPMFWPDISQALDPCVILYILNSLGGCKYKIYNMTTSVMHGPPFTLLPTGGMAVCVWYTVVLLCDIYSHLGYNGSLFTFWVC